MRKNTNANTVEGMRSESSYTGLGDLVCKDHADNLLMALKPVKNKRMSIVTSNGSISTINDQRKPIYDRTNLRQFLKKSDEGDRGPSGDSLS